MSKKLNFTPQTLLDIKFEKDVKGYNPLEVDKTLDQVIEDYQAFEENRNELNEYIHQLESDTKKSNDRIHELETEVARLSSRLNGLESENDSITNRDNIDLLKRIRLLENALYKKGVDPNKIK